MSVPIVTVVLVNWNGLEDTLACLQSLASVEYEHDRLRTVVVDNGSANRSEPACIRREFPDACVIETGRNLGFTGGNNVGIRHAVQAGADYILCLNTDTRVESHFLTHLVAAMEADAEVGIAGPAVYRMDQPDRLATLGCGYTLDGRPAVWHLQDYTAAELTSREPIDVPFVEGCALLMRRDAAEQLKGFDDTFFAYVEDADLCLRARALGWRCVAVPQSHIWHRHKDPEPDMSTACRKASSYYSFRNCWHLVRRHGSPEQRRRVRSALLEGLRAQWWEFAQQCAFTRQSTPGSRWMAACVQYSTLTGISYLGLKGPRERYRLVEAFLNAGFTASAYAVILLGRAAFDINALRHRLQRRPQLPQ